MQETLLDPYKPKIHALLSEDPKLSAVRIFDKIEPEGYQGQLTILREYLRQVRPEYKLREVYLRMSYQPGQYAQVDWGEMPEPVLWQGQLCKVYAFVMVLCYSRLLYLEFSLSSQLYDFLRCHQHGLTYFAGVPQRCVYDNLTSVVKQRRGKEISFNDTFVQCRIYFFTGKCYDTGSQFFQHIRSHSLRRPEFVTPEIFRFENRILNEHRFFPPENHTD